jgi:hypothetical protein
MVNDPRSVPDVLGNDIDPLPTDTDEVGDDDDQDVADEADDVDPE